MNKFNISVEDLKLLDAIEQDYEVLAGFAEDVYEEKDETIKYSFNIFIKKLRLNKGLTIGELSLKINLTESTLLELEKNSNSKPSPNTLLKISNFYDIPMSALLQIVGAVRIDDDLKNGVVKFAAESESFEKLTSEEKVLLNDIVKIIKDKYSD